METSDLESEWRAAQNALTKSDAMDLLGSRFPKGVIMHMVGIARVRVNGGLYEPDELGGWCFVSPVRIDDDSDPYTDRYYQYAVLDGDLVDIVCWHIGNLSAWALRCGSAEWLGCASRNEPTHIRTSPVRWLRNKCDGLVLLTTDPIRKYEILSDCNALIAEDEYHAELLGRALVHPYPRKPVLVA